MTAADSEGAGLASDIARVRKRLAELEALATDNTRHGASPRLVRALVTEWRSRLEEIQRRRDALLRRGSNLHR